MKEKDKGEEMDYDKSLRNEDEESQTGKVHRVSNNVKIYTSLNSL